MAERPVFIASLDTLSVKKVSINFKWFPGYSKSQKQKSINDLHEQANAKGINRILEVSSKSPEEVGVALSAFNLKSKTIGNCADGNSSEFKGREFSVESAFQGSKVFEAGGPYKELVFVDSRTAKKDPRIKNSGSLTAFKFFHYSFGLEPKTFFYDWLYVNTLLKNRELIEKIKAYSAFTDIEFNPNKSVNCQAFSLALFRTLLAKEQFCSNKIEPEEFALLTKPIYERLIAHNKVASQLSL